MENKKLPSNKKLISVQEEKVIREFDYDSSITATSTCIPKRQLLLEIIRRSPEFRQSTQKILVSIKPRAPPIKTLYIAEKSRFHSKIRFNKSGSRLAIGDHTSFNTHFSDNYSNNGNSVSHGTPPPKSRTGSDLVVNESNSSKINNYLSNLKYPCDASSKGVFKSTQNEVDNECYNYGRPHLAMNNSKVILNSEKAKISPKKVDIATLVVTNTPSKDTFTTFYCAINKLHRRIDYLEHKILRREMVYRPTDRNVALSSSDDEMKTTLMKNTTGIGHPGCSYIEQYSHIPETSAFQRHPHQGSSLSPSKATTLDKEHNSEQYGRDFTAYDGITARGRRQCASVPCKRDDIPKMAAERVHKIRHKLNPVRDYRLMDTVHYLAQGEFAPRDDGIKLTPSREAVLSDIIWEDVCRTHWPNTRLGRRIAHPERPNTRGELQRLIDNLLRERVAHVERRRRRHYRIVKLNNRHENCRTVGKTGDIIVAKSKHDSNRPLVINDHKTTSAVMTDRHRMEKSSQRSHKSYERLIVPGLQPVTRPPQGECFPGTSYAAYSADKRSTNYYQKSTSHQVNMVTSTSLGSNKMLELTSNSGSSTYKAGTRQPRLVIKKDVSRRKNVSKDEPNLEHFIILPTLVVRTPSNMKRQKKFNELYHRILNVHLNGAKDDSLEADVLEDESNSIPHKKDIGFNINITPSESEEIIPEINRKK